MTVESQVERIGRFLIANGFEELEPGSFGNDYCAVSIEGDAYAICDNNGHAVYSEDLEIYFLVGYLTWKGYMHQHFTKIFQGHLI